MKISQIAIVLSSLTLLLSSFYNFKNGKKAQAATAYAGSPYNRTICVLGTGGFSALTTVKVSGGITYKTAQFKTINGAAVRLTTQINKTRTIYFRP